MSTLENNLFARLSTVVDEYYEGNASAFCRASGLSRQYYSKMKSEFEEERKEPDIGYQKLRGIISALINDTDVSLYWFLTGKGGMEAKSSDSPLSEQVDAHKRSVNALHESGKDSDEIAEYLVKNREVVLKFLRSLEDDA